MSIDFTIEREKFLMKMLDSEKRHVFAVKHDKIWIVDSDGSRISCVPVKRDFNCTD